MQSLFVGHFSIECVDVVAKLLNDITVSEKMQLLSDVQSTDYLASVRFTHFLVLMREKFVIVC